MASLECAQGRQRCFLGRFPWWGIPFISSSGCTCFCPVAPTCTSVLPSPWITQGAKLNVRVRMSLCLLTLSLRLYASLKRCYCASVGKEKCIPSLYCTHLFSGDNLASSFSEKIKATGCKISHHLSQNSP